MSARTASVAGLVAVVAVAATAALLVGGDDEEPGSAARPPPTDEPAAVAPEDTLPRPTTSAPPVASVDVPELPDRGVHPKLLAIDGWLQSDVESLEDLRGQVVAVQFWTFACRNCKATVEHMQALYSNYHDEGFEIVGIHAPEFSFEAEVDNIVEAAADQGITWPIVLDTDKRTFHHWQEGRRAFWPRIYLLDRDGHIRYDHIGEGRYAEIDAAVQALLAEPR